MTTAQLGKLFRKKLDERGMNVRELSKSLCSAASHQTIYNAIAGKPIRTDTLLAIMDELGLKIVEKGAK